MNLLRQKKCTGLIQSLGMIAFLGWNAIGATRGVIRVWTVSGEWWLAQINNL